MFGFVGMIPSGSLCFEVSMSVDLKALLQEMVRRGASDLHVTVGERARLRVDGALAESEVERVLTGDDTLALARAMFTPEQMQRFEADNELDLSFEVPGLARFRANAYRQKGGVGLVVRQIPFAIPTLEELGLPKVVQTLAERPRGLVLVTGPTGSGKSTTLAAMVDRINRDRRGHILTVEDPIEFVHTHRGCIVNQREVGADTRSFAAALKHALRQDPDVILVGEMRDLETIQAALTIAETGHLCLATLHTNSAPESVNRIIDVFPAHQQSQVRAQLAFVLEGVVTQTLLPRARDPGRVAALEILIATPAVRACIRDDKVHQIHSLMQAGKQHGMQTLNDALCQLYLRREVTLDECLKRSPDPADLQRMAGGSGGQL
jgi:twitching motility protein PilT